MVFFTKSLYRGRGFPDANGVSRGVRRLSSDFGTGGCDGLRWRVGDFGRRRSAARIGGCGYWACGPPCGLFRGLSRWPVHGAFGSGTLVGQRVFGIALGYKDLLDHDVLRGDPIMAVLAGKLRAKRRNCAPVAGKSTLNRLELGGLSPSGSSKIVHDGSAIADLLAMLSLDAHEEAPERAVPGFDATDDPVHGSQESRFFHVYYDRNE